MPNGLTFLLAFLALSWNAPCPQGAATHTSPVATAVSYTVTSSTPPTPFAPTTSSTGDSSSGDSSSGMAPTTRETMGEADACDENSFCNVTLDTLRMGVVGILTALPRGPCNVHEAILICREGYDVVYSGPSKRSSSNVTVRCTGTTWKVVDARDWTPTNEFHNNCWPRNCTALKIAHANLSSPSVAYNTTVAISCDDGFIKEGVDSVTCLVNKSWSAALPKCRPVVCLSNSTSNGVMTTNAAIFPMKTRYAYNEKVTLQCVTGYVINQTDKRTNATLQCGQNEKLDFIKMSAGVCKPVNCNGVYEMEELNVTSSHPRGVFQYGTILNFTCSLGYTLVGSRNSTCQADGEWSANEPMCNRTICDPMSSLPGEPVNEYRCYCPAGQRAVNGSRYLHRLGNGNWSDSISTCEVIRCPALGNLTYGTITTAAASSTNLERGVNSTANTSCWEGYELDGPTKVICSENGKWTPNPASDGACKPVNCGGVYEKEDVNVTSSHPRGVFEYGTILNFSCSLGYNTLVGSRNATCQADGEWSASEPMCNRTICDPMSSLPGEPVNEYRCYCPAGQRAVNGSRYLHRLGNGNWSDSIPTCEAILCPTLGNLNYGTITTTAASRTNLERGVNATANASCWEGYVLDGPTTVVCSEYGEWTPNPAWECHKLCPAPDKLLNGTFELSGGRRKGSLVRFSCNDNFRLQTADNTSEVIFCEWSGYWNATAPQCIWIDCGEANTNQVDLEFSSEGTGVNATIRYTCPDGFIPSLPQSKCMYNGTWYPNPTNVTCITDTSGDVLRLAYTISAILLGSTLLLIGLVVLICCCMSWLRKRRKAEGDRAPIYVADAEETKKKKKKRRNRALPHITDQDWTYDNRQQQMRHMTIVRPGGVARHGDEEIELQEVDYAGLNGIEVVNISRESGVTLTTSLPSDAESGSEPIGFSGDQLEMFTNNRMSRNILPLNDNPLAAELDDLLQLQSSKWAVAREVQLRGSESDVSSQMLMPGMTSSLSRAGSQSSATATLQRWSLPRGVASPQELESDVSSTVSMHNLPPRAKSDRYAQIMPQSVPDDKREDSKQILGRRPSMVMDLIKRYDPSAQDPRKLIQSDEELAEPYDTPDALRKQVTSESPRTAHAAIRRRTNSDVLPPVPSQSQRRLHGMAETGSTKDIAASGESDARDSDDEKTKNNGYEDLKAIQKELERLGEKVGEPREKTLMEMLEEDYDGDSDSIDKRYEEVAQRRLAEQDQEDSSSQTKLVTPYADLRAIRAELERDIGPDDIITPYARVPPTFSDVTRLDNDEDSDGDAKPYARVPHRMSLISSDDRETITTGTSFRVRSMERASDDEGISTGTSNDRPPDSDCSQVELPHLGVIIDQPHREGEKTPPYARIRRSTKKRSSVTLPASLSEQSVKTGISKRESFGEDSGVPDSSNTKRKNSLPHNEPHWRQVLKDQWSGSEESDMDAKIKKKKKKLMIRPSEDAPSPVVMDLGPISLHPDQLASTPASTPKLPARTAFSRILDKPGRKVWPPSKSSCRPT